MPHPLLETKVMTEMVRLFPVPPSWFRTNIFPVKTTSAWQAEYYVMDHSRKITPFQGRGREGTMRPKGERSLRQETYLHLRPKDIVKDVDMQSLRKPGSSDTSEAYGRQLVVDTLDDLRREVDNTFEWIGAQVLQAATVSVTIDGATVSLTTGLSTTHVTTASAAWSTVATDVMGDINTSKDVIRRDSGLEPEFILMCSSVHTHIVNNTVLQNYFKETTDVNNIILNGRIARLSGLDVVVYDEYYVPDDGTATRIWGQQLVLFGCYSSKARSMMLVGPPEDIDMQGVGAGIGSKSWKSEDPAGVNVLLEANFYPALPIPDAFLVHDVVP